MATINISNLRFGYDGGEDLFSDVSLQIDTRWKLGLIGRNGRGKTTLLKLLLGRLDYEGRIEAPVAMDYFPYVVENPARTTRQVVEAVASRFLPGISDEFWKMERELSLLQVREDVLERPFDTLSGGERTKVLLAALFSGEERFLLLDEPTNHLDMEARTVVGCYLHKKSGFILASHDRTLLDLCTDHILSINRSDVEILHGNYSAWQQSRDRRDRFEEAENRRLRKDVERLRDAGRLAAERSRSAERERYGNGPIDRGFVGSRAARTMRRARSIESRHEKAAEEKSKLFKNSEVEDELSLAPLRFHASRLVDLSETTVRYDGKTVFENVSMSIDAGDRIALCGRNGCGKSTLLKLIAGEAIPHEGRRSVPASLKISYLPQDASFLRGGMREWIDGRRVDESLFKAILHKLGFPCRDFDREMSGYSDGQKKKVLLATSLCDRSHLYLWDEPLNYIDLISRIQIERLLVECRPTLIFVEHDKAFLDNVATGRIEL